MLPLGKQPFLQTPTKQAHAQPTVRKQMDPSKILTSLRQIPVYIHVQEFDRATVQKLPVGAYYVRKNGREENIYCVVARILDTGDAERDILKVPFELTPHGLKETKWPGTFDSVDKLIDNYARQNSLNSGAALPILISHRLGNNFDGSIDESTAIARLRAAKEKQPEKTVFVCIPSMKNFKLMLISDPDKGVQTFEYKYYPQKDGFVLSEGPSNSPVFQTAEELLRHHHLDEASTVRKILNQDKNG